MTGVHYCRLYSPLVGSLNTDRDMVKLGRKAQWGGGGEMGGVNVHCPRPGVRKPGLNVSEVS